MWRLQEEGGRLLVWAAITGSIWRGQYPGTVGTEYVEITGGRGEGRLLVWAAITGSISSGEGRWRGIVRNCSEKHRQGIGKEVGELLTYSMEQSPS